MSQFLAAVGRSALASQLTALCSAKLATVESRDQTAAKILTAASLELDHCNKHVNAQGRLAVIASPALSGHSSNAHEPTEHHSEELLDKLLATMKTTLSISTMLTGWHGSMASAQAASFMDSLQQGACTDGAIPAVCWRLLAISLQRDIFVVDSQYLRLSAATAVLLVQSAFMLAQMPESLTSPCSSKHGHSLASTMALAACPFQTVSSQETPRSFS